MCGSSRAYCYFSLHGEGRKGWGVLPLFLLKRLSLTCGTIYFPSVVHLLHHLSFLKAAFMVMWRSIKVFQEFSKRYRWETSWPASETGKEAQEVWGPRGADSASVDTVGCGWGQGSPARRVSGTVTAFPGESGPFPVTRQCSKYETPEEENSFSSSSYGLVSRYTRDRNARALAWREGKTVLWERGERHLTPPAAVERWQLRLKQFLLDPMTQLFAILVPWCSLFLFGINHDWTLRMLFVWHFLGFEHLFRFGWRRCQNSCFRSPWSIAPWLDVSSVQVSVPTECYSEMSW